MRYLAAVLAVLLLCCAPVSAQTGVPAQPAPTPIAELPNDTVNRVVTTATDAAERIGVTAFVAVIVAVIALLLVLIAGYWIVRVGVKPLLDIVRDERNARKDEREERLAKERELAAYRERQANAEDRKLIAQERQVEQYEVVTTKVIAMGTKTEDDERTNAAVQSINTHIDEAMRLQLEQIERLINRAAKGVDLVQEKAEQRMSTEHETVDLTLPQVQTTLKEASERVKKLHDTGPLGQPSAPTNDKHKPED